MDLLKSLRDFIDLLNNWLHKVKFQLPIKEIHEADKVIKVAYCPHPHRNRTLIMEKIELFKRYGTERTRGTTGQVPRG